MDLNKLSRGDQVIGISAIVLFIFSFFNWLGFNINGRGVIPNFGASASAWHFTLTLLAVLLGFAVNARPDRRFGFEAGGQSGSRHLSSAKATQQR